MTESNEPTRPLGAQAQPMGGGAAEQHAPSSAQGQPRGTWGAPGPGDNVRPQFVPGGSHPTPPSWTPGPGAASPPPRPQPQRRVGMAGLLAVAVLSAGIGGGVGVAADRWLDEQDQAAVMETSSGTPQVVQGDPTAPDWAATAEAVSDAVVAIQLTGSQGGGGAGSGVIIDADGTIVTNNHVISGGGAGAAITVVLGAAVYDAEVVGTDPSTDLAVIRLVDPPTDLAVMEFGDSDGLRVGDPVMAIGNPLGLADTVTTGIVSALNRPVTTRAVTDGDTASSTGNGTVVTAAIQTNAAINPGNSGGALVDAEGRLVGIPSSIATLTSNASGQGGNIGIGFAIPVNQARIIVDQLLSTGTARHPQLGVTVGDVVSGPRLGAEIGEVVPDSAAAEAGIQPGDVVVSMDGVPVTSSESLVALVRGAKIGEPAEFGILRDGEELSVTALLRAADN